MSNFKYKGPVHLVHHAISKVNELYRVHNKAFFDLGEPSYLQMAEVCKSANFVLRDIVIKGCIDEAQYKYLKILSLQTEIVGDIIGYFRSSSNNLILHAAEVRFSKKSSQETDATKGASFEAPENKENEQNLRRNRFK